MPQQQAADVTPIVIGSASKSSSPMELDDDHSPLRLLIAPSGFKESLEPREVAEAMETGIRRGLNNYPAFIHQFPLYDGGEGFCRGMVRANGGELVSAVVSGPTGDAVSCKFGLLTSKNNKTAVIEIASAAGLRLIPKDQRDPTTTSTYGVGQLIRLALDSGCAKIVVGCGDSGTSDGGAGMLQALGVRLLDQHGHDLPQAAGGGSLVHLADLSFRDIHPRLRDDVDEIMDIEFVCNTENVLCGSRGVARVFGPQKGATPEQVNILEQGLERLAAAFKQYHGADISEVPGSGASGGLGTGLLLLGACIRSRRGILNQYFQLDHVLDEGWDIVFTGEGTLDELSVRGKVTTEIAQSAKDRGAQVIALAGVIGKGAEHCYDTGISAFTSISKGPSTLEKAIEESETLIQDGAEKSMRMIMAGLAVAAGR